MRKITLMAMMLTVMTGISVLSMGSASAYIVVAKPFEDLKKQLQSAKTEPQREEAMRLIWKSNYIEQEHTDFLTLMLKDENPRIRYYATFALYGMGARLSKEGFDYSLFNAPLFDDNFSLEFFIEEILSSRRGRQQLLFNHFQDLLEDEKITASQQVRALQLLVVMSEIHDRIGYKETVSRVRMQLLKLLFASRGRLQLEVALVLQERKKLFSAANSMILKTLKSALMQEEVAPTERFKIVTLLSQDNGDVESRDEFRGMLSELLLDEKVDMEIRKASVEKLSHRPEAYVVIPFLLDLIKKDESREKVEYAQSLLSKMLLDLHLRRDNLLFPSRTILDHVDYDLIFPVMEKLLKYPYYQVRRNSVSMISVLARPFKFQEDDVLERYLANPDVRMVERVKSAILFKKLHREEEEKKKEALKNAPVPQRPTLAAPPPPPPAVK